MKKIIILFITIIGLIIPSKALASSEEYSLDNILRNYTAVTFGANENSTLDFYNQKIAGTNKGEINGLTIEGNVLKRNQAGNINIDEMYVQVINESNKLLENADDNINSYLIKINKPGIYTINNTSRNSIYARYYKKGDRLSFRDQYYKLFYIEEYDPNKLYVFNFVDTIVDNNIKIEIVPENAPSSKSLDEYISEGGNYTGNIILNFPNARFIKTSIIHGTILAPKADVYINTQYCYKYLQVNGQYGYFPAHEQIGSIYANSITQEGEFPIKRGTLNNDAKVSKELGTDYKVEYKDYTDDAYYGDYSIMSMLKNYSLITLGQKDYEPNTKLSIANMPKGSANIFHIAGQFLINSDLMNLSNENNGDITMNNPVRVDLESNLVNESYVGDKILQAVYQNYLGNIYRTFGYYVKYWELNSDHRSSRNELFINGTQMSRIETPWDRISGTTTIPDKFIDFNRLYNTIVEEQKRISEGTVLKSENGIVHVKIGGTYTIEDISNVQEIIYDDFESNKDKLTIITIKNDGNITLPIVTRDTQNKYIETNDYYGKKEVTQIYETQRGLLPDDYHGNIVFSMPNANYIKLGDNAPFVGHIIAPKADIETQETQIAGCVIANSFYAEGNSELHFYPINLNTNDCIEYKNLSKDLQLKLIDRVLYKTLGGSEDDIERIIVGNQAQYNADIDKIDTVLANCDRIITINPETYGNIILLVLLASISIGTIILFKNKKRTN